MSRRHQPTRCKICGVHNDVEPISKRGYCYADGLALRLANIDQLQAKDGPLYEHWERRMILAARRLMVSRQARLDNAGAEG